MSDDANVAPGGAVDSTSAPAAPVDNSALSVRDAAAMLASRREPNEERQDDAAKPEIPANAESDSARPEAAPAENAEDASDPAEKPSIEPPRSWSKEDKELFLTLPPETQARIADREQRREVEIRRGQNDTAEGRKALEAERLKVEQARAQYENALPALLSTLEEQNAGEFGDIKSWDDYQKLAEEDPFRFAKYQAHQARINDTKRQILQAQQQRSQEDAKAFETFAEEQDRLFLERAPEFADGRSAEKARRDAAEYLTKEIGFAEDELAASWNGRKGISIRDAKVQTIIRDAMKWRSAQRELAARKPVNPIPAVQKPGVAVSSSDRKADDIKSLDTRLSETGSLRDAAALLAAQRAAQRR